MNPVGYAVFFHSSEEFAIEQHTEIEAQELGAVEWFPTFSEAKAWSIDHVKAISDSYRRLLRHVRTIKKSEIA